MLTNLKFDKSKFDLFDELVGYKFRVGDNDMILTLSGSNNDRTEKVSVLIENSSKMLKMLKDNLTTLVHLEIRSPSEVLRKKIKKLETLISEITQEPIL